MAGLVAQLVQVLLRPRAGQSFGAGLALAIVIGALLTGAAGFALAALHLALAPVLGPALAALATAGVLVALAGLLALGARLARARRPPPAPDAGLLVVAGFLAGLAGISRTEMRREED